MMDIDWSKAPDGTTHYYLGRSYPWVDISGGNWKFWNGCAWEDSGQSSTGFPLETAYQLVPIPSISDINWYGAGLPPVGTVCEYAMDDDGDWEEVEVIAHYNGYAVVAIPSTDGFNVDAARHPKIRPIRTAEQIAAEEREKAIIELSTGSSNPEIVKWAEHAYDNLGYRRQNK